MNIPHRFFSPALLLVAFVGLTACSFDQASRDPGAETEADSVSPEQDPIAELLQNLSTREEVPSEHAKRIVEQCATVYARTRRLETRIALVGALWMELGGRFRGSALDTLIAIEPDTGLRERLVTLRQRVRWGQIADLADVRSALER